MNSISGPLKKTYQSMKDLILKELIKQQKPQLDAQIDEMLKPLQKTKQMVKELGLGKKIGKPLKRIGAGLSLLRRIF